MPPSDLDARCTRLVEHLELGTRDDIREVRPLTGGVSSDIALVELPSRRICVKFALDQLRVAATWYAPTRRNRTEYDWLAFAHTVRPGCVPDLLGRSEAENGFAMAFLEGAQTVLWKTELLGGEVDSGKAPAVGDALGALHAASTAPGFDAVRFANHADFRVMRLDPYMRFTAAQYPAIAPALEELADAHFRAGTVLIHGDVSPKNILFHDGRPVFLDAECSTLGDPSFDVAFCLNHLVLKAVHMPACRDALLTAARRLWTAYRDHLTWEPAAELEARVARLLPVLMLGRIDGKSPVEYLDTPARQTVRDTALPLISAPPETLDAALDAVRDRT